MSSASSPAVHLAVILSLGLLLGGGCAMQAPPPGLPPIRLTKVNSARVTLWNVGLEQTDGRLFLRGHVLRHYPAANEDTSLTHLAKTLFNSRNEILLSLPAEFEPRQIPRGHRLDGYSSFSLPLDRLPEQANRIEIRACDDPIPSRAIR